MSDKKIRETFTFNSTALSSTIPEPTVSQWYFMDKSDVENLIKTEDEIESINIIRTALNKFPSVTSEDILSDLFLALVDFCRCENYSLDKCGAALSIFFQTHVYFTSQHGISGEKVYKYFNELIIHHSVPFPPNHMKIFTIQDGTKLETIFCKIYLKNLPLIANLYLPNLALKVNYEIHLPPPIKAKSKDKKKGKKK